MGMCLNWARRQPGTRYLKVFPNTSGWNAVRHKCLSACKEASPDGAPLPGLASAHSVAGFV
jgi:formate dehydrogenase maturation protein FdhE